jgi:hypothetical protein
VKRLLGIDLVRGFVGSQCRRIGSRRSFPIRALAEARVGMLEPLECFEPSPLQLGPSERGGSWLPGGTLTTLLYASTSYGSPSVVAVS